jgi:membrane peptidoglycan carboxypeptidase
MCDSTSEVTLGAIRFHPFLRYDRQQGKKISIAVHTSPTNGTEFFNSLPEGMFEEVRDIQADGTLAFSLDFGVDLDHPDSVYFETSMKKDRFRIRKAGELYKMNGEFTQQVYEYGRFIRSFQVGPSNPFFTPYEFISQDFKNAVMTSEDGSFFYHNGFNEEAFRKSIATNIKAKKFVRGGSTISMQLVKNVFLTRKKTIARKAEEALIVWLIESNRIYSKERMFEVYLNIIELGPNIYGIGEASRFYFNKLPSEITLQEGIFLASLLPHPKWFRYSFDKAGNLKPYFADYYRVVSNFLLRKNLITQEQHDQLQPYIELKGPAKELVVPSDTVLVE